MLPSIEDQEVTYQFRRVTCRGDDWAKIVAVVSRADGGFDLSVPQAIAEHLPHVRYTEAIKNGFMQALGDSGEDKSQFKVTLKSVTDVSGESAPFAFERCAYGAIYEYLGRTDEIESAGLVNET